MKLNPKLKKQLLIIRHSSSIALKLIILDQITKWWLISFLKGMSEHTYRVTSFFDLAYVWNYGISFGFFREYYQYSNIAFGLCNSLIVMYIYYLLLNCRSYLSFLGYSAIIGGAIGNLIDRFYRGAVFDFLYFHWGDYGLFIFNLADSFISIGVAIVLYDFYKLKKSVEAAKRNTYDELEAEAEKIRQESDKYENSRS
jgi:signal peptidase II